ncbi:hypothetical protein JCM10449v2_007543 [Rhodotorula kratochvilovae]
MPPSARAAPPAPSPALPAAAPPPASSSFRPLARTASTASAWSNADVPATSAYDLPESTQMAVLERAASQTSVRGVRARPGYAAGAGLKMGRTQSRRRPVVVVGAAGRPEEDGSAPVIDEEVAVGAEDEVVEETVLHAERMYARFSARRKRAIVGIVAYAALLAPLSSSSFLPSIPQICEDLNTTASIVNVTVAAFILAIAIFPLFLAPYSGLYGRRPIYLLCLPIFALGCMGTALSQSLGALIATRIIQAFGSSPVLSIGAGTISDLYPKHERGAAMGLFYLGILLGPASAPAIAGILTEYVRPAGTGWRAMQWLLMAFGASAFALIVFFLPETAHVKGVDLVRQERLQARAEKTGAIADVLEQEEKERRRGMGWARREWSGFVWVWVNPLGPIRLLMHPTVAAISLNSSFTLMSTYTILVPLSQTLAPRYNITNAAILGCFYLAQGVGNALASRYTGIYADWTLRRWLKHRGGHYYPEDRLRASLVGGAVVLPCSVLALGWVLDKGSGKAGMACAVVLLVINGIGLMCVLTPSNTYVTDLLGPRSPEGIAINNACRYTLSAAASAFVLPMIERIGVGWTNTFAAAFVWLGCATVVLTIRYGDRMRAVGTRWEGSVLAGGAKNAPVEVAGVEEEKSAAERGDRESDAATVVPQEAAEGTSTGDGSRAGIEKKGEQKTAL